LPSALLETADGCAPPRQRKRELGGWVEGPGARAALSPARGSPSSPSPRAAAGTTLGQAVEVGLRQDQGRSEERSREGTFKPRQASKTERT